MHVGCKQTSFGKKEAVCANVNRRKEGREQESKDVRERRGNDQNRGQI